MHSQALVPLIPLFASLTVGESSSTARAHYNNVCPEHDGQEKAINSHVFVTYHCDQRPSSRDRTVISTGSPDESGRNANTAKSCVLYHSLGDPLIPESNVVFMTHRTKEDPLFPEEDNECKHEQAQIGHLQVQLHDLKHQLETCHGKNEKEDFKCPEYEQDHFYDRGTDYKVYYGLLDDEGWTSDDVARFGDKTPKECVQACTDTQRCKRAIWITTQPADKKGLCWLRDYTVRAGPIPTKKTGYSRAHLQ
ncbi:hypothetical protein BDV30DRAFT_238001 [Aspergillus minisclerotigenes]|uniref:Apple domain-containing protein n=1 Tax=Aspergillus minisclerotigenes TaxID=656917 RepID=A0A5N6J581_9EURO|nr:hypothetical protein BDV30DRAFT_238001 [Aspergillus minisclerotigenes]